MAEEVVLLSFWPSYYGMRVSIALEEKGINYELKEEAVNGGKSPLLLKMNPIHKKLPVLIHNGRPICESLIILEYIDQIWNHRSPLLPSDPYQRSQVRFWADYVDDKVYPSGRRIWMSKGEEQEAAKEEFMEGLKVLEGELGEKAYFGGETMGFIDVSLVPMSSWFYALETCANFNIEAECPKLMNWVKRCMEKESVSKSLPDPHKVNDLVLEIRKWEGLD
ncbi:probable glutathione S-transferase parA [Macadamia integrifolia]|uniref:probable glutathione S-transferase parA n=1 Tax=Macadamia integrifolia TaxID=60698 RepID=UPI001C532A8C|nr:probable glutathione S-transferase parA [Macadamia integrifolia]